MQDVTVAAASIASERAQQMPRLQLTMIGASVVVMGISQSILYAVLPPLAREIQLTELQVGILISFAGIFFAMMKPFWGRLSDKRGGHWVLAIGLAGYGIASLTLGLRIDAARQGLLAGNLLFACLLINRLIQGSIGAATLPAAQSIVADQSDRAARTAALSLISAGLGIGMLLGPIIGAALSWWSLTASFYVLGAITLVATIIQLAAGARRQGFRARVPKSLSLLDPRISTFVLLDFLMLTFVSLVQTVIGFIFQDRLALTALETAQRVGVALVVSAICSLIVQVGFIRRVSPPPRQLLRLGSVLSLAGVLAMFFAGSFLSMCAGAAVIGFGLGMLNPGTMAASSIAVERSEQGAVAGLSGFSRSMGYIVGPFVGAAAYDLYHGAPLLIAAGVDAVMVVISQASGAVRNAVAETVPVDQGAG